MTQWIRSYEKYGKFYFTDGSKTIETVELFDCKLVVFDRVFGYIYKSKGIHDYEIEHCKTYSMFTAYGGSLPDK